MLRMMLVAGLIAIGFSQGAGAVTVPTNWFTNATSVVNVIDPPRSAGETDTNRLRLADGFTSGSVTGMVALPFSDLWTIDVIVAADGNVAVPDEFVEIRINGVLEATFFNTPVRGRFPLQTQITGDSFTYDFTFSSSTPLEDRHMIVQEGTATSSVPLPPSLLLLLAGLAPLAIGGYRQA